MGAEIEWHVGSIRFGPKFKSAATEDEYAGAITVKNLGNGDCYLFAAAGVITRQDVEDILRACANAGFKRAFERRHRKRWVYDLTTFKRKRA